MKLTRRHSLKELSRVVLHARQSCRKKREKKHTNNNSNRFECRLRVDLLVELVLHANQMVDVHCILVHCHSGKCALLIDDLNLYLGIGENVREPLASGVSECGHEMQLRWADGLCRVIAQN